MIISTAQVPMKSGHSSAEGGIEKQANETFRQSRNLLLKNQRKPPVSVLGEVSFLSLFLDFYLAFSALFSLIYLAFLNVFLALSGKKWDLTLYIQLMLTL